MVLVVTQSIWKWVRERVLARSHPQPQQRDRHGEVLGVGAHVGEALDLVAEESRHPWCRPGWRCHPAPPWIVELAASRRVSVHLTGRPSSLAAKRDQDLVVVDVELAAESAADLGGDHLHRVGRQAEGLGDGAGESMRDLGR